jgi:MFS family permease
MVATMLAPDVRSEIRWLAGGFLLMLCSGFGQTYFIALFAGHLKTDLAITDGQFGNLYGAGTLASAAVLVWAGRFADRLSSRWLGAGALAGLAASSLAMASVASAWMLALALSACVSSARACWPTWDCRRGRWFKRKRGRAVAIAGLGFPPARLLPLIALC